MVKVNTVEREIFEGLNFRGFRWLAILHENYSLIKIICYNMQRFKGVASGKQSFREHCATKCF